MSHARPAIRKAKLREMTMKVVFLEDVEGVARGGEVKEVKMGFARNYLIPHNLAMPATRDTLQRIDRLKQQADDQRIKTMSDMKRLADELRGKRVDVPMRAGASGRLYGSVTNAIVADTLSHLVGREIDRRNVQIPDSIREVGVFQIRVHLYSDIVAPVQVLVHPIETNPEEFLQHLEERRAQAEAENEESGEDAPAGQHAPGARADSNTPSETDDEAEPS